MKDAKKPQKTLVFIAVANSPLIYTNKSCLLRSFDYICGREYKKGLWFTPEQFFLSVINLKIC